MLTHWKRPQYWERLRAGGEGDDRRWLGWHHWLDGHEFEQALGDGEGQGSLVCCSPWGCKESDTAEWPNNKNNRQVQQTKERKLLCREKEGLLWRKVCGRERVFRMVVASHSLSWGFHLLGLWPAPKQRCLPAGNASHGSFCWLCDSLGGVCEWSPSLGSPTKWGCCCSDPQCHSFLIQPLSAIYFRHIFLLFKFLPHILICVHFHPL